MSGQPGSSSTQSGTGTINTKPKAIANLAKRQEDVTRRGTSKLKFTPVLPIRRKKEESIPETTKAENPPAADARGRGRGSGRGRGRGDARGGVPRTGAEMTATGPLALGPTMTGSAASRRASAPRSNFSPAPPLSGASASGSSTTSATPSSSLGAGLTHSTAPSLKREGQKLVEVEAEKETYSDPDDGVEIIDIDDVKRMDWMAPESLRKEKVREKKGRDPVKRESSRGKGKVKAEPQDAPLEPEEEEQVDLANALDLSESEDEEELEDIFNDFALQDEDQDMDLNTRQEKLYFFQFPEPFPSFLPPPREPSEHLKPEVGEPAMADATTPETQSPKQSTDKGKGKAPAGSEKVKKVVSFAPDVKPPASGATTPTPSVDANGAKKEEALPAVPVDGVIGRLEIHQSGAVKMRLDNGILLDITAATQPSFLQHAVHIDTSKRRLSVIGEVNRRFVVSPDIDALLESLEAGEQQQEQQQQEAAIAMDVDKLELETDGSIKMEKEKTKKSQKSQKNK